MRSSISICRSCLLHRTSTFSLSSLIPITSIRNISTTSNLLAQKATKKPTQKYPPKKATTTSSSSSSSKKDKKEKPSHTHFRTYNQASIIKFSLLDAIRYIRAFEVGNDPRAMKYDLAVKIKTIRNGPTVKSRMQLPRPVKTDLRICVFSEGEAAKKALAAGASVVGTEELWESIKLNQNNINFDRCLCHTSVAARFQKQNLGKILGPKQLMPNVKSGTIVSDVAKAVRAMIGASEYRERSGVVRLAIGQLGFTAEELAENIKVFMGKLRGDLGRIEGFNKTINEVVLSSTNSPGFSLSGEFKTIEELGRDEVMMA